MFPPLKTETVQILLDEARYLDTKPPERHDMRYWQCGSTSCAVGDMMLRGEIGTWHDNDGEQPWYCGYVGRQAVECLLSISSGEVEFLFYADLEEVTELPHQTAARIRKYLYYRLRKAEILADYEQARRREGDWGIAQSAMELAEAT